MAHKNPEMEKKYQAEYRKNHKERLAVLKKQYRAKNRKRISDSKKIVYLKNRAVMLEQHRAWNKKHYKEYYLKNRDRILERHRLFYLKNRDKLLANAKQHAKENQHIAIKRHALRRLRIEATIESESAIADFIKLIRNSKWVYCYYCDKRIPGKKAHIDHIVPLARGGSHSPDNLCASCAPCNQTKSAKLISEWKRQGQQILSL